MSTTNEEQNSSINLTLDKKKIGHLIEALLFSSSVNIGAEWEEKDFTEMINLAKELKSACNDNVELDKICFYKEQNYEDNWSKEVLTTFNKLIKTLNLEKA